METLQFDRRAYTEMQARLSGTDGRRISLNEYAAAGVFALSIDFSEAMDSLAAREPVADMQQASAWIDLAEAAGEYNLTPAQLWAGLQECAARGMLTVAVNMEDPEQVFVQLAADPATTRNGGALGRLRTAVTLLRLGRAEVMTMDQARQHRERIWRLTAWGGVVPGSGAEAEKREEVGRLDA
ncbi:hypothetical protein [Paracoccus sp. IB05]|uniref:hypothetical protein n=1 Tax=Paracoccus sp. IB05 TaxID=2779367 RepID=UPI0018E87EF3|nr:hypothetical protein [Paracoccus sp. IB05]MBJ2152640.1 hypothetical protein [Paracoccus sp. IB05]